MRRAVESREAARTCPAAPSAAARCAVIAASTDTHAARGPVLVVGMHRSGTSMVTKLLHRLGLHLGPEEELLPPRPANPDGYWENRPLVLFNARLLERLGAGWDLPPVDPLAWEHWEDLEEVQAEARRLLGAVEAPGAWGWKDPRTSLLLPFWRRIVPGCRVVVCVRNPLEVLRSLRERNDMSPALGRALWLEYAAQALAGVPASERVVTHFDAYFNAPEDELRRVARFAGLETDDAAVAEAVSGALGDLRHHRLAVEDLPGSAGAEIIALYSELCREAGWVDRRAGPGRPRDGELPLAAAGAPALLPSAWAQARARPIAS